MVLCRSRSEIETGSSLWINYQRIKIKQNKYKNKQNKNKYNFKDQKNLLNKKSELMNKCCHENKFLLSNFKNND